MKNGFLYSIIVVLFLWGIDSNAQTPGYTGKRFSAGYGFYTSPAFIGSGGESAFNALHEAYLEYAIKKKVSMGFSARFYNAVYANTRMVQVNPGYSSSFNQIDDNPSGVTNIKARNYMLYFKFFKSNYIAPWGKYFILGASLNTFTSVHDPNSMKVRIQSYQNYPVSAYESSYYFNFGAIEQEFVKFDVVLGFGRSRIIANRVILDYGYNINAVALALTLFDAADDRVLSDDPLYPAEYIEKTSSARIRGVNRFNVFLKVGVLLF